MTDGDRPAGRRGRRLRETPAMARERRAAVDDTAVVMEAAAAFLAVRPRSTAETHRRLTHLGYREQLVEQVVARLVEMGYLDDGAFAQAWVDSRDRSRPRGTQALRRELALKGVSRQAVDEVLAARASLAGATPADDAAARSLLARRRSALEREPDPRRRRQRAYALLARNGFEPDVCATVAGSFIDEDEADVAH